MLHLIKLCVGVQSPADLLRWQRQRAALRKAEGLDPRPRHRTRNMPRRREEILDGGSLYWVIRHEIRVRQRIVAIEADEREDGRRCAALVLDLKLVPTEPVPRRPFQGWRYLNAEDAPGDLAWDLGDNGIAPELRQALEQFGLRRWADSRAAG